MKATISSGLALVFALLLIIGCKKEDPNAVFNTSFFTTRANGRLSLYVDDVYKGDLPYFSTEPVCGGQNSDGQLPLTMQLKTGEYRITGKDSTGRVISSGTVRIGTCRTGASGGIGGQSLSASGSCVIIGLFE